MDLQEFESQAMYFDKPMSEAANQLLHKAADSYSEGCAEPLLLQAMALEPDSLTIMVGLYRFYFYQHRYSEAIDVAHRVMATLAPMISFPADWQKIHFNHLANGVVKSFTMVRFYLMALKGAGYMHLRLNQMESGMAMLHKVIDLDSNDRLGVKALLQAIGPLKTVNSKADLSPALSYQCEV